MLQQLNDLSATVGFKMNYNKTKINSQVQLNITIQNHCIGDVEHYVFLGYVNKQGKLIHDAEIKICTHLT